MRWVDVAGVPGVGKSAICDELWTRQIGQQSWAGTPLPPEWDAFVGVTQRLTAASTQPEECRGLVEALLCKVATVARMPGEAVYANTALAQIGLEFGWRLTDPQAVSEFYELMPVSAGVVFMFADLETVRARNRTRRRDFSERVVAMDRAREVGQRILIERGVAVLMLDTTKTVDANRRTLQAFVRDPWMA